MAEWDRQKDVQSRKKDASILELGFSTLFLNRTNRSGIIRGGMIGGRAQSGEWNIKCRFDKDRIINRIKAVGQFRSKIKVTNYNVVSRNDPFLGAEADTLVYFDPPYYEKANRLYMNHLTDFDHKQLSKRILRRTPCPFIITYDAAPQILKLYSGRKKRFFDLAHTAARYRVGQEVLVASDDLVVPRKVGRVP